MKLRVVDNPPNPYLSQHAEWLVPPPPAKLEVYEERARSILSRNDSPDLPYTWSVNPYRGCQHACAYCYARCTHEYLGFGAGTDFDTKLVAKVNAPELLRRVFARPRWDRQHVHFSGVTDCYQPLEANYELTRRCLEVCLEFRNPACVVTKGALVMRDAELLAELNQRAGSAVQISIPFADAEPAGLIEPQAPPPARRFEAVRRLREAGVPVGILVSPIIPGLTDQQVPRILELAAEAGAESATYTALRLPGSVVEVFTRRLQEALPLRAQRVLARLRDIRGGRLSDSRFGARMRGEGPYWESIARLFELQRRRVGLDCGCLSDDAPGRLCGAVPKDAAASAPREAEQLSFDFAC
ncbi:MAG TPA: PA0069 family radical SAM protein [Phycisphaerae bacterium]|nr:PA0069 family radical SAM protein [Phycisphaerae bacterium]HNU44027.1 PA0069 family radical SAM protein [Phycisphaerae bacterium]